MCNTCGCKKAEDISKDIFGNKSDAMDRAEELGSNHTHSHKINGDMIHMPFKTHQEYQENMGAESFEAEVYAIEDGGKTEMSFQELFDYLNSGIDNEYFLTKKERDDYYDKVYLEYDAESFEAEYSVDKLSKMSFKEIDRKSGFLGDMLANLGVMDSWTELSKSKRKEILNKIKKKESWLGWEAESFENETFCADCGTKRKHDAESFDAPGSIAEDYSEVLHDLDDLEGDVKKLVAPKRRPTKYLRDAKSSVVDSWRQVRKDGFGRELYQPMDMDAESFEAESNFDKLANKIAAQYRAKGKSPAEAMRIGKATAAKIGFRKYGKAGMRRKAMAGRAKSAENYGRPQRIKVNKKSSIINYKSVGILSVAGILSYLHFKK